MTTYNRKPKTRGTPRKAVALSYAPETNAAPIITAKGAGASAERILDIAREHGVPVREDASLVEVLSQLELEREIPPELYKLVAEILSFAYQADQELSRNRRKEAER